jgi:DNA-binding transcriptional MocR family regulator
MTNWTPDLSRRPGPRYLAIAAALAEDITAGRLSPGARVPTHRELAYRLGLTVGTVTRAYAEAIAQGLIDGETGRGTFVRQRPLPGFADVGPGPPRPGGIDFGLNYPPMHDAETAAFAATMREITNAPGLGRLLGYVPHAGLERHRGAVAAWLRDQGVPADPARTMVTAGAQHGMMLAFAAALEPGNVVLVDTLTFPGMISLATMLKLRLFPVEMDDDGVIPDALEAACRRHGARAYYAIPTLHNPTCATIPADRRRQIARIAKAQDLLIIEDDIYRFLEPDAPDPLLALAPEHTIFINSAAKQLAPGLRIGGLIAPAHLQDRVENVLRNSTWMAPPPMAEVLARWVEDGTAKRLGDVKRQTLQRRQTTLRACLAGLAVTTHPSGMHAWLKLPEGREGREVTHQAAGLGVSVSPGDVFAATRGPGRGHIRICLGNPPTDAAVTQGLTLLGDMLNAGVGFGPSVL